jgi:uracil-DNA glycosylase family 4
MEKNVLGVIRRYLLARQGFGMDVAYRVGPGQTGVVAEGECRAESSAPRRGEREIVMITSPAPLEEPAGRAAPAAAAKSVAPAGTGPRIERKPGIRVTSGEKGFEQASLFGESAEKARLDLSKLDCAALDALVSKCERCALAGGRTRTVFGSGDPSAKIVFIGEAPGREEDLQGLPFVGRAGQLLTKMLAAVGFTREEVYITNILKCRPPGNREPQEDEMAACEPYLIRQIELIAPAMICALGRIAAHGLLKKGASLGALRQGVHYFNDVPVVVMYHPAALLRNPNLKRDAWEDLQAMRKLYDEAIREGE